MGGGDFHHAVLEVDRGFIVAGSLFRCLFR